MALDRAGLVRELRHSEDRFRTQALSDALTGLPNRTYFVERLTEQVDAAQREGREADYRDAESRAPGMGQLLPDG